MVPVGHSTMHDPAAQTWPTAQARPQAPQLRASVAVAVHTPPQRVWPEGQAQAPVTHDDPPPQAAPQAPQLALLD